MYARETGEIYLFHIVQLVTLGNFFDYYSYYYYFRPGAPTATSMLPKMTANIEPTGENPTQWTKQNTWAA